MAPLTRPLHRASLALEGFIADIMERSHPVMATRKCIKSVSKWIAYFRDFVFPNWADLGNEESVNPKPASLVNAIAKAAVKSAVTWGAGCWDYPDSFKVRVSREAWASYYGHGTETIGARLAEASAAKLREWRGVDVDVKVELECDLVLNEEGSAVEAGFSDTKSSVNHEHSSHEAEHEASKEDQAQIPEHTPSLLSPATASLRFGGRCYEIEDGMTVGVLRDKSNRAGICLPYSDDLTYVSAIHGAFHYDANSETWIYEQIGRNGSQIITPNGLHPVGQGESMSLESDCSIKLGNSERDARFVASDARMVPHTLRR